MVCELLNLTGVQGVSPADEDDEELDELDTEDEDELLVSEEELLVSAGWLNVYVAAESYLWISADKLFSFGFGYILVVSVIYGVL